MKKKKKLYGSLKSNEQTKKVSRFVRPNLNDSANLALVLDIAKRFLGQVLV